MIVSKSTGKLGVPIREDGTRTQVLWDGDSKPVWETNSDLEPAPVPAWPTIWLQRPPEESVDPRALGVPNNRIYWEKPEAGAPYNEVERYLPETEVVKMLREKAEETRKHSKICLEDGNEEGCRVLLAKMVGLELAIGMIEEWE